MVPATTSFPAGTAQNVRKVAKLIRPGGFHPESVVPEADIRRPNFTERNKKLSESWLEFATSYPWSYAARAKEGRPSCTQTHGINACERG
jgi:hypothetical protein